MNKSILCLTFILISFVGLAQEKVYWKRVVQDSTKDCKWANQINRLIQAKFILLQDCFLKETRINKRDLLIAVITDTSYEPYEEKQKIVTFQIVNSKLKILDSTNEFERDGRGPYFEVDYDSIKVSHSYHRGVDIITYKWSNVTNKYLLVRIESENNQSFRKKGIEYSGIYNEVYDVTTQILTEESKEYPEEHEEKRQSKKKIIHKKLPSNVSLKLKNMKDPNEYEELL